MLSNHKILLVVLIIMIMLIKKFKKNFIWLTLTHLGPPWSLCPPSPHPFFSSPYTTLLFTATQSTRALTYKTGLAFHTIQPMTLCIYRVLSALCCVHIQSTARSMLRAYTEYCPLYAVCIYRVLSALCCVHIIYAQGIDDEVMLQVMSSDVS